MNKWNYRVIKFEGWLAIHSVYYNSKGVAKSYASTPAIIGGESIEEIREQLNYISEALEKPIIDNKDFV